MPRSKRLSRRSRSGSSFRMPFLVFPLFGIVFLLPALTAWKEVFVLAGGLPWTPSVWGPLLIGSGVYGLIRLVFHRPMTLYVFGHELTHATVAWMSGYRVKSLFVSDKGGEVELSNTNVTVALAPYCVPVYAMAILLVYAVVRCHATFPAPPLWVTLGLGWAFTFHYALTFHVLRQSQPDLKHGGLLFSFVMIALFNALGLVLLLKSLFPREVQLAQFGTHWVEAMLAWGRLLWERVGPA